jgi:glycosyltransferase involved in cell wall biosynthesis
MRVLAFTKYGTLAASTRQRFIQYRDYLGAAGIELEISPLLDNDYLTGLMGGGRGSRRAAFRGYIRRFRDLFRARKFDVVWVHCEFFPYFPGVAEALAVWITNRPIVFDYDDAIFHMYDGRFFLDGKLESLLRRVSACTCGNVYLREYAGRFCDYTIILPTVVDTDIYRPAETCESSAGVSIGWIGSPATWPQLRPYLPILEDICRDHGVTVRIVGAGSSAERDHFPGLTLINWDENSEVAEVQRMKIGIMPLFNNSFERGKSGYKLVQYMACGLPVVASAVGANCEIVNSKCGFLVTNEAEWRRALDALIRHPEMRTRLGAEGRKRVRNHYSLASQAPRLAHLLRDVAGKRQRV